MWPTENKILSALPPQVTADLGLLDTVPLKPGQVLNEPFAPLRYAYFPTGGVISVMSSSGLGESEIGMVGREGMVSLALVFGADRCMNRTVVQVPGDAHRIEAALLLRKLEQYPEFRSRLLRYGQCWTTQISQTSIANARNTVRERLARWLVMCQDRIGSDTVTITHEALAAILGVRRPGVTVATHELEGDGAIRAKRGCIRLLDRAKLEGAANGSYGVAEREYERLIIARPRVNAARNGHELALLGAA